MIDKSAPVSESVIFIANISGIRISVILHIGVPLHDINIIFNVMCLQDFKRLQ